MLVIMCSFCDTLASAEFYYMSNGQVVDNNIFTQILTRFLLMGNSKIIDNVIIMYRIISLLNAPGNLTLYLFTYLMALTFFCIFFLTDRQLATDCMRSLGFLIDIMTRILMIFLLTFCNCIPRAGGFEGIVA